MRRESFLGQVLTAVARSAPVSTPVRQLAADTRMERPASQLLTALARSTPAFTPGSYHALNDTLRAPRSAGSARNPRHSASGGGSAEDLIDFDHQIPAARRRGSYRQALVVVFATLAIPVLVASIVIVKATLHPRIGPAPMDGVPYSASPKASPKPTPGALTTALALANKSPDATGKLPPSSCKQDNPTHVTCTAPAGGISGVVFQTYPSLKAMYAAYTAKVASLNSKQFKQNFNDCGPTATFGEVSWNHLFKQTRNYTVDQMTKGTVRDDQAAGRVFCNYTQGLEYMVWTQNDGHLMGYVAGPVHGDVWNWWVAVHHNIGIGSIGQVTIAAAAAQNPHASSVAAFLDSYFTAINTHDYQSYISLLSPQVRQGITAEQFQSGYKSVVESAETLDSISTGPNGDLVAAITFTSHQDPAQSPDQSQTCTNWTISLVLKPDGDGYLIDPAPPGYHASYSACP